MYTGGSTPLNFLTKSQVDQLKGNNYEMLHIFPKHFPSGNYPLFFSQVATSNMSNFPRPPWHLSGPKPLKAQRSSPLQPAAPQKAESKMYIWKVALGKVPNTFSHFSSVFSQIIVVLISGLFSKYFSRKLWNLYQHFMIKRKKFHFFSGSIFINSLYIYSNFSNFDKLNISNFEMSNLNLNLILRWK